MSVVLVSRACQGQGSAGTWVIQHRKLPQKTQITEGWGSLLLGGRQVSVLQLMSLITHLIRRSKEVNWLLQNLQILFPALSGCEPATCKHIAQSHRKFRQRGPGPGHPSGTWVDFQTLLVVLWRRVELQDGKESVTPSGDDHEV